MLYLPACAVCFVQQQQGQRELLSPHAAQQAGQLSLTASDLTTLSLCCLLRAWRTCEWDLEAAQVFPGIPLSATKVNQ